MPPPRLISILLWPEQSQTSPMRMLPARTVSLPLEALSVCGSNEAAGVSRRTSQRPSPSARVLTGDASQEALTLTVARGSAVPQMRACVFCWRTMLSPMREENFRLPAWRVDASSRAASSPRVLLPMGFVCVSCVQI